MAIAERRALYQEIEDHRKRPLIVYVTSARRGAEGSFAADAVREFVDQLHALPDETVNLDLLVNSMGGDGLTSWRLVSMIRERIGSKGKFSVLVPHFAFSAATLLALGADEIYMYPFACLGPIDPQITVTTKEGKQGFGYQDVVAFAKFLEEEGKISEQTHLAQLLGPLINEIKPSVLGASKRSSSQSVTMAKRLLKMHMSGAEDQKADVIAESLNKSFFSHGHAVSPAEAKELGLKIKDDSTLNDLMWKVYEDIEDETQARNPFDPLAICLADPQNRFLIDSPPVVNIPANAPQQVVNQIWQASLQSIKTSQCIPKDYDLIHALIESTRHSSRFITKGKIFAARKPDLDYIIGAPKISQGWETL